MVAAPYNVPLVPAELALGREMYMSQLDFQYAVGLVASNEDDDELDDLLTQNGSCCDRFEAVESVKYASNAAVLKAMLPIRCPR
jgi:hypothetical protein